jgi:hypothetical protein
MPVGIQSFEFPCRRALAQRAMSSWRRNYLYFPGQVVSHHRAKRIYLVTGQPPSRDDIEATISFGVTEDGFLRSTPIVEQGYGFGRFALVGFDNFSVVIEITRLKQV